MNFASGNRRVRVGAARHVVGALLDQRLDRAGCPRPLARPRDPEPEQVVEQAPAGAIEVVAWPASKGATRGVVALAVDEPVHAAEAAGLKAPPPEAAHPLDELLRGHLAREQSGEALRVGVKADLDRHERVAVVARDQLREDVGAAAPGAADEDQLRRLRGALGESLRRGSARAPRRGCRSAASAVAAVALSRRSGRRSGRMPSAIVVERGAVAGEAAASPSQTRRRAPSVPARPEGSAARTVSSCAPARRVGDLAGGPEGAAAGAAQVHALERGG